MRMQAQTGQMAELLKFFAEDFDAAASPEPLAAAADGASEQEPPEVVVDPEAIRDAAYQEGLRDGLERAAASRNLAVERVLAALEERLRAAQYQAAQEVDRAATSVARLLIQALMKMLPSVCARYGAREIAQVARAVLPGLRHEPQVVVAVHPAVAAEIEAELARLGGELKQRTVLAATDSIPPGDVRISWQDGSAARDTTDLMRRIAAVFAEYGLLDTANAERPFADAAVN